MTKTELTAKAKALVAAQTTRQLVEAFELTDELVDTLDAEYLIETSSSVRSRLVADRAAVTESRGWVLDELEARDADALEAYLDGTPLAQAFGVVA